MQPVVKVFDDKADFDRAAAEWVAARLASEGAVVGLATGGSPVGMYAHLVSMVRRGEVSFASARCFNLDEYVGLPADHDQSYARYMRENLYDHVDIDLAKTHIPNGMCADPDREAAAYDSLLQRYGPVDAQVLGIGANGHIGFNEPGTPFSTRTHTVELTPETRSSNARFFHSEDEVPKQAITMGIANILEARSVLLLAHGARKAAAVRDAFQGLVTVDVPASALQEHADVTLILDPEAASALDIFAENDSRQA